ncbi:MAG: methyl-accepting chemotaxis protein [Lachnospiraceae bacterium]|nr:methyl-accepting chemotaxis protein [Lachnospiraceae bacterium]
MNNFKVRTKIIALSLILILSAVGLGIMGITEEIKSSEAALVLLDENVRADYDKNIRNQVENAISLMETIYAEQESGNMTEEECKEIMKKQVTAIRYNGDGYFWIDDTDCILIAHPTLPDQVGNDRTNTQDEQGNYIIQNIVKAAERGEGYTDFYFNLPNSEEIAPKRAYSALFKPYNWIVSTGNYTNDIDALIAENTVTFQNELNALIRTYVIVLAILILVSVVVTCIIARGLTSAFKQINVTLANMSDGDFTPSMRDDFLKRRDDFGAFGRSLDEMRANVGLLISNAKSDAGMIVDQVSNINDQVSLLDENIEDVSSTTEELAAGMEETAASAQEMTATTQEIEIATKTIAEKSTDGAAKAVEISERANKTKDDVKASQMKARKIRLEIQEKLEKALEDAKVVEKINVLSDAIMGISSQTNLLALNASIEAARAGEAGRGFAVVATEIGGLADQSATTVSQIQKVTADVTKAVNDLADSANSLLSFVVEDVVKDYQMFAGVAEKYDEDAAFVDELVTDFSNTTTNLLTSINDIRQAVDEVARAANEGAEGTTNIAEKIMEVRNQSQTVLQGATASNESAENLKAEIAKFQV